MTDQRGKPLDDKEATCRLPPDINPKSLAASFTKKRWPETRGGFNRKIGGLLKSSDLNLSGRVIVLVLGLVP